MKMFTRRCTVCLSGAAEAGSLYISTHEGFFNCSVNLRPYKWENPFI